MGYKKSVRAENGTVEHRSLRALLEFASKFDRTAMLRIAVRFAICLRAKKADRQMPICFFESNWLKGYKILMGAF